MPSEIRRPFFQDPGYLFFFFPFCLVQSFSHALLSPFHHIFDTAALLRNRELDSRYSFCFFTSLHGRLSWVYDFWFQLFPDAVDQPDFPLDMISICILGFGHFSWTSSRGRKLSICFNIAVFLFSLLGGCLEFFYFWLYFWCHTGWIPLFLLDLGV